MGMNSAPRDLILEQSKLRKPVGQPKLDIHGEKPAPIPDVVSPQAQVEPVENSPSSQPISMEPILVSTSIRINLIENKEYLSFTTISKDNVNPSSEKHIGISQRPLLGGPMKVENFPKDFINGISLQFDRGRSAKVRPIPKTK